MSWNEVGAILAGVNKNKTAIQDTETTILAEDTINKNRLNAVETAILAKASENKTAIQDAETAILAEDTINKNRLNAVETAILTGTSANNTAIQDAETAILAEDTINKARLNAVETAILAKASENKTAIQDAETAILAQDTINKNRLNAVETAILAETSTNNTAIQDAETAILAEDTINKNRLNAVETAILAETRADNKILQEAEAGILKGSLVGKIGNLLIDDGFERNFAHREVFDNYNPDSTFSLKIEKIIGSRYGLVNFSSENLKITTMDYIDGKATYVRNNTIYSGETIIDADITILEDGFGVVAYVTATGVYYKMFKDVGTNTLSISSEYQVMDFVAESSNYLGGNVAIGKMDTDEFVLFIDAVVDYPSNTGFNHRYFDALYSASYNTTFSTANIHKKTIPDMGTNPRIFKNAEVEYIAPREVILKNFRDDFSASDNIDIEINYVTSNGSNLTFEDSSSNSIQSDNGYVGTMSVKNESIPTIAIVYPDYYQFSFYPRLITFSLFSGAFVSKAGNNLTSTGSPVTKSLSSAFFNDESLVVLEGTLEANIPIKEYKIKIDSSGYYDGVSEPSIIASQSYLTDLVGIPNATDNKGFALYADGTNSGRFKVNLMNYNYTPIGFSLTDTQSIGGVDKLLYEPIQA